METGTKTIRAGLIYPPAQWKYCGVRIWETDILDDLTLTPAQKAAIKAATQASDITRNCFTALDLAEPRISGSSRVQIEEVVDDNKEMYAEVAGANGANPDMNLYE